MKIKCWMEKNIIEQADKILKIKKTVYSLLTHEAHEARHIKLFTIQ